MKTQIILAIRTALRGSRKVNITFKLEMTTGVVTGVICLLGMAAAGIVQFDIGAAMTLLDII